MPFGDQVIGLEGDAELRQPGAQADVGGGAGEFLADEGFGRDDGDGLALFGQRPGRAEAAPVPALVIEDDGIADLRRITSSGDQTLPLSIPGSRTWPGSQR